MTKTEFLNLLNGWVAAETTDDSDTYWTLITDAVDEHWTDRVREPAWKLGDCSSCHQPIIWTVTQGMKRMPVDPVPTTGGNVQLAYRGTIASPLATVIPAAKLLEARRDGIVLRTSHFATCPNAAAHRRAGKARA